MDNIKKVTPNEIGLEIGLVLSLFFFNTEHLHFGFWPEELSVNINNLKKVQSVRKVPPNEQINLYPRKLIISKKLVVSFFIKF